MRRILLQLPPRPQQYPFAAAGPPVTSSPQLQPATAIAILIFVVAIFLLGFFSFLLRFFSQTILSDSDRPAGETPIPECIKGGGLDSATLDSLPVVAYSGGCDGECVVCLSEFEEGGSVKLIPYCGHVFHPTCLEKWLRCHVTCPLCRSAKLLADEDCSGVVEGGSGFIAPSESTFVVIEPLRTWGSDGVRRISSCSDLDHRTTVISRSNSF